MIITKTPFRISFVGGGSDMESYYRYYTGKVLSTSIDKYIYVAVKKQLGIVEFKYRVNWSQTEFRNSIDQIKHPIVREALRFFKIDYPIEITTFSDIPSNTGLASSSAFAVGLVHALLAIEKRKITKYLIAKIAAKIEVDILKRNIGKQDHYACSFGGFNEILFYKNGSVKVKPIKLKNSKIKLLNKNLQLYYTSIKRNASKVLKHQKNLDQQQINKLRSLTKLVKPAKDILVNQNQRISRFGKILHTSWILKKGISSNVTNNLLDKYYFDALKTGVVGGKILGAGKGGFFLFYIEKKKETILTKKLNNLKKLDFKFDFLGSLITYNENRKV